MGAIPAVQARRDTADSVFPSPMSSARMQPRKLSDAHHVEIVFDWRSEISGIGSRITTARVGTCFVWGVRWGDSRWSRFMLCHHTGEHLGRW